MSLNQFLDQFEIGEIEAWVIMGSVLLLNVLLLALNCARKRLGSRLSLIRRVLSEQMLFVFVFRIFLELIPLYSPINKPCDCIH